MESENGAVAAGNRAVKGLYASGRRKTTDTSNHIKLSMFNARYLGLIPERSPGWTVGT